RPHDVVAVLSTAHETFPQGAFGNGAQLAERTVSTTVHRRRPTFEPVHAKRLKRECQKYAGGIHEHSGPPERRSQCEAHLGGLKLTVERPELKHPNRGRLAVRNDPD